MKGWIVVAQCSGGVWAALLRSYLEGAGVPVWVENEHIQATFGGGLLAQGANPAFGPLRLWVPIEHGEKAQQLIEELFS